LSKIDQHDHNRITEDGAEAVALALAHRHRAWRVIRRMQREEHADWLLEDAQEEGRRVVALEVSGVDRGSIAARLSEKLAQVAKSVDVDQRWARIVGFEEPAAALHFTKRKHRGN
jgi:Mg-chelatase subunit ChlI